MPKQISNQVENDWSAVNTKGGDVVTAADLKKVVSASVINLGKLGGKDKFNQKLFNEILKDSFNGQAEFEKKDVQKIVTQLVSKAEGKEN